MLIRLAPPSSLRISNRIVPDRLTVNVAVENDPPVVERDVPTWVHVLPPFCDANSPQVPLASEPKLAWWIVTVPAPVVRSNSMVTRPLLRMRADFGPVLTSVLKVPISASLRFHVPEPSVTLAAAKAVLVPASNPSLRVTAATVSSVTGSSPGGSTQPGANIAIDTATARYLE